MELSVVIPIYHSAKNASYYLPELLAALRGKYKEFEILFIIDNVKISDEMASLFLLEKQYPEVSIRQLKKNYGQHFATMCGYYLAKGDFILSVDEDMTKYASLICTTDDYKEKDAYYFCYDKNNMYNSGTRKLLSNIYKFLIHKIVNLKEHSTFRVISKSLRDKMLKNKHYFWNLDVMVFDNTKNVGRQEVVNCDITDRDSGYNYKKLFLVAFEIAYEHNTLFTNFFFASFPTILYGIFYHYLDRAIVVYIFFSVLITLFFRIFKLLSPSTITKIRRALKEQQTVLLDSVLE